MPSAHFHQFFVMTDLPYPRSMDEMGLALVKTFSNPINLLEVIA
jgi:hypothetical protein